MYKRFVTALLFPLCMGGGLYAQQLAFPGAEGYGRFAKVQEPVNLRKFTM